MIGIVFLFCFLFSAQGGSASGGDKLSKFFLCIYITVLILFSFRIMARNWQWGDPVTFYTNELQYTQTSARIYNNLAMELADRGDCVSAIPNYEKAIELSDVYPQTHHNLARCLLFMGQFERAREEYLKALQIQPSFSYSVIGLQNLEQMMRK